MLSSLVALLSLVGTPPELPERPAYLFSMQVGPQQQIDLVPSRYRPQAGDLVLFDDHSRLTKAVYRCCGTGTPLHAGIVVRRENGTWAILEAGTNAVMKIFVFDLEPRLREFDGTILIRQLHKPLTPEQTTRLAHFAAAQKGKPYALGRVLLQLTPFRPRNAPFAHFLGRTELDRNRWICSELVVAAATAAGVWELNAFPGNGMYPRDLCYDEHHDLSPYYQAPALWYPRERLEQVDGGVRVLTTKKR